MAHVPRSHSILKEGRWPQMPPLLILNFPTSSSSFLQGYRLDQKDYTLSRRERWKGKENTEKKRSGSLHINSPHRKKGPWTPDTHSYTCLFSLVAQLVKNSPAMQETPVWSLGGEDLLGNLPDPGIKPMSLALAGGFFTTESPGKPI